MKISYIHDFCFYKNKKTIFTAVGLPEKYFDRFFHVGVSEVNIISRNRIDSENVIKENGFDKINKDNIKIPVTIPSYLSLFNPLKIFHIIKLIKQSDFLVINFPSLIGLFVFMLNCFLKKNYILEIAADDDQFLSKKGGRGITYIFRCFFPCVVNKSSGAIYVSSYLKLKYPHEINTISSNVYIDKVRVKTKNKALSVNENINILFAGGVNKRKGIDVLLKSISVIIKSGYNQVNLHIAGGHFDNDYRKLVNELKIDENVIFHGLLETSELNKLYEKADIYSQPSRAEGIPRATIEAMSYGLPVVATKLPGFKEILSPNCLVDCDDYKQVADMIIEIIEDESLYENLSLYNSKMAENFLVSTLNERRNEFYYKVLRGFNEKV